MRRKTVFYLLMVLVIAVLVTTAAAASDSKLVALTFDDGPGPYTEQLLDGLQERGIAGTFFVQGIKAKRNPQIIRRMVEEGHQLANHSYNHPDLASLPLEEALDQLHRTDDILNRITNGVGPYFYRAPYGQLNHDARRMLEAPVFYWTMDCQDWVYDDPDTIRDLLMSQVSDGSIVLLHDTVEASVIATLDAIDLMLEDGYEFVTLKELFRRRGDTAENARQYYSYFPNGTLLDSLKIPRISGEGDQNSITVTLESTDELEIYYTTDGSPISMDAQKYEGPFEVELPCTIRAVCAWDLNGGRSEELQITYREPPVASPEVDVINGLVTFTRVEGNEDLYYRTVDEKISHVVTSEDGTVKLKPGCWFTYYADAEQMSASQEEKLLFSKQRNLFADVDQDAWYYADLDLAAARGYIEPTKGAYVMDPESEVTRGMLAQMLYRFSGEQMELEKAPFLDVSKRHPYAEAIAWGAETKLFSGTGDGMFEPDLPVSRQEVAKILASYLGPQENVQPLRYQDGVYIARWAYDAVSLVTSLGLMHGNGVYFEPHNTITRGEMSAILIRMDQI